MAAGKPGTVSLLDMELEIGLMRVERRNARIPYRQAMGVAEIDQDIGPGRRHQAMQSGIIGDRRDAGQIDVVFARDVVPSGGDIDSAGGLMSYGTDIGDGYKQTGIWVALLRAKDQPTFRTSSDVRCSVAMG